MKIAVVGSGISGLSIAQLLKPKHEVHIFEKKTVTGGLIKCERVNDCLFHKVGGHVFNSKHQEVLDWFWSFFDREAEFTKVRRNAKVLFDNQIIGYPIENHLYKLDSDLVKNIVEELLQLQKVNYKSPFEYRNFESFLKGNFGNTLFTIYFEPYNKKIWRTDLSEVSMEWLEGKLPMPNLPEIVYSNILRKEEDKMVHSEFFYPKDEGSQFLVNRLSQGLNVSTNFDCQDIQLRDDKVILSGEVFDKLIYTGDIRQLPDTVKTLLTDNGVSWNDISSLRSNGTSNLFCETDDTDISWLYIPQDFTKAHRIIYTGNFSKSNNRGADRTTCVVEFSGNVEHKDMVQEIKKLPGNLTAIASNYEPNSYVVQQSETRKLISETKSVLELYNFFLLGRFAEWEYYNMDKAIEAAFLLTNKFV